MKKIILTMGMIGMSFGIDAQNVDLSNNTDYLRIQKNGESDFSRAFGINSSNQMYIGSVEKTIGNIYFFNKGTNYLMTLKPNGNVGVGTTNPNTKLEIKGPNRQLRLTDSDDGKYWQLSSSSNALGFRYQEDEADAKLALWMNSLGNVGIGTRNPDERLTVKGKIHAEEVRVDLNVAPDYVFQKYYTGFSTLKNTYSMPTLEEIEVFTKKYHHLPEMPSAEEIKKEGLHLKQMTTLLLQKLEELTLYTIEQEKRIKALEKKLATAKK